MNSRGVNLNQPTAINAKPLNKAYVVSPSINKNENIFRPKVNNISPMINFKTNTGSGDGAVSGLFKFCNTRRVTIEDRYQARLLNSANSSPGASNVLSPKSMADLGFPEEFDIVRQIGSGSFSSVYEAIHKFSHCTFALKKMSTDGEGKKELSFHKRLDHPFIAAYYGSVEKENTTFLCIELVKGPSLLQKVNQMNGMPENMAQKIFCQLLSALHYLHSEINLVHRDLKLENVILDENDNARLIDFGLSKSGGDVMTTLCGSMQYTAPEILQRKVYTEKVDFWSLGVMLYGMLYARLPFESNNMSDLMNIIVNKPPLISPVISSDAIDLLTKLLTKDPTTRFDFEQIKNHIWVKQSKYSHFLSSSFFEDRTIKVIPNSEEEVDQGVARILAGNGVDVEAMKNSIFKLEDTLDTLSYRILRHLSINLQLDDFRSNEGNNQYSGNKRKKTLRMTKSIPQNVVLVDLPPVGLNQCATRNSQIRVNNGMPGLQRSNANFMLPNTRQFSMEYISSKNLSVIAKVQKEVCDIPFAIEE